MLTYNDEPIIKRAINRRVGSEVGVKILGIIVKDKLTHITVGIHWQVDDKAVGTSIFDLPSQFELSHVHNECDEIAEQIKEARAKFRVSDMPEKLDTSEIYKAKGNGRRGQWRMYGERANSRD